MSGLVDAAPLLSIAEGPIDRAAVLARVVSPHAGAETLFTGTVRASTRGREVLHLEYEAYAPMAERRFREIADELIGAHGLTGIAIVHRVGRLEVGEVAVAIAVSAPHRAAAYEASRAAIEAVKHTAPIWKKEVFRDGEAWVEACGC
jgi:molybdopterin synthase catalytic subunit